MTESPFRQTVGSVDLDTALQDLRRFSSFATTLAQAPTPPQVIDLLATQLEAWYPDRNRAIGLVQDDEPTLSVVHASSEDSATALRAIDPSTVEMNVRTPGSGTVTAPIVVDGHVHGLLLVSHPTRPLVPTDGETIQLLASITGARLSGMAEQSQLQQQLIQSEKMSAIGQLIAGVAHDLNNPLASVVGFADYLVETNPLPEQYREPLRVIQQEADRAAGIVKNLLTFARKHEGRRRPTALPRLLEATTELLHNELASNKVELLLETESELPELYIEPNQIQQVVVNLVTNAAQAIRETGREGRILVRAKRWSTGVVIDVSDNGPGIPEEEQEHIFEPFFTTKTEGLGTGLGLSISQGLVTEHGGHILLVSSGPNGTAFRVELPATHAGDEEDPAVDNPSAVTGLRILIVDDEPHILHYMQATLEAWGHTVAVARDGRQALDQVHEEEFDVIITDLRMPGCNGREFYETLRVQSPEVAERVVFSTGDTVRGDTLDFLEAQGRPCLQKPFSLTELRSVLTTLA